MARASSASSRHFGAAIVYMLLLACSGSTTSVKAQNLGPSTLVLYEHEDRVAPGRSVVTTASPSGNYTIEFGTINVVANILRDGVSNNSTQLGKAVGLVTFEDDLSLSLAFSFVINTTSYAGSLTVQGVLDVSGNGQLVITGGTGDFLWGRGYADVVTISTDPADVVFKNTVYLKYD